MEYTIIEEAVFCITVVKNELYSVYIIDITSSVLGNHNYLGNINGTGHKFQNRQNLPVNVPSENCTIESRGHKKSI